jgi:3-methyl-2-oxobutanoate hydroxymethyltransferase
LSAKKRDRVPLTWLTCYDYSFAAILNNTELDLILVGDSGGMVVLGYDDTVPVTMDEMIMLASSVRRGAPNKFIVGDMPKGSYESSDELAISNAMRFCKEAGCDAVKLEGGFAMASRIRAIVQSGIPVIGHLGLTPQSASAFGGYRVVGKKEDEALRIKDDVEVLENSGAFAILIEAVPPNIAKNVAEDAQSIIFGIGAGKHLDGQLLILHDLLGIFPKFRPKFAKCFIPDVIDSFSNHLRGSGDLLSLGRMQRKDGVAEISRLAVEKFISEVRSGNFPTDVYSY